MPRIRTVKPEFWADEKLGPMDPVTRLVFLALISLADDAGRLLDSVKQLDGAIFPYTSDTCRRSLDELVATGRVQRGCTKSGQRVLQLVNWHHQKIDKPNLRNALPPIVEASAIIRRNVGDEPTKHTYDLRPTTNDRRPTTDEDDQGVAVDELAKRLPEDCHTALRALTASSRNPTAWLAELGAQLDGMHGGATPDVLGLALRDMEMAGAATTGRTLRGFISKAKLPAPSNGHPERPARNQRNLEVLTEWKPNGDK